MTTISPTTSMTTMTTTDIKYPPRLGRLAWFCFCFGVSIPFICLLLEGWEAWLVALSLAPLSAMLIVPFLTCSYSISGNSLKIKAPFNSASLPIDKISEVRLCNGYLAGPSTSTRRVSIKFSDRKVLKSSMPIEISPKDREAFVNHLLRINPAIRVIR